MSEVEDALEALPRVELSLIDGDAMLRDGVTLRVVKVFREYEAGEIVRSIERAVNHPVPGWYSAMLACEQRGFMAPSALCNSAPGLPDMRLYWWVDQEIPRFQRAKGLTDFDVQGMLWQRFGGEFGSQFHLSQSPAEIQAMGRYDRWFRAVFVGDDPERRSCLCDRVYRRLVEWLEERSVAQGEL